MQTSCSFSRPLFRPPSRTVVALCIAAVFSSLSGVAPIASAASFDDWASQVASDKVRNDPEQATRLQYFKGAEQNQLDRLLTPNTPAYRAAEVATAKATLAKLNAMDRKALTPQERAGMATIAWNLQSTIDGAPFDDHRFVFNQFTGLHVQLVNFLTQAHPIRNRRDIENYLARLKAVSGKVDTGIARARDAAGRGFLMPTFITNSALGQLDRLLDGGADKNVLLVTFVQRMAKLGEVKGVNHVTPAQQARFAAQARAIVSQSVLPAFERTRALLREQLPRTTDDAGLWRLPCGDQAYAVALRQMTSSDYTPQQVHDIGLREVARIEQEMEGLLVSIGYKDGSIKQRMAKLEQDSQPKQADPQPNPQAAPHDPRPALLERYTAYMRDAEVRAKTLFDHTPKAPVEVRREPPFTEQTAAAHYSGPARDGSLPGIFWAPLPGPDFRIVGMRTLVYHEAVPGHHFQIALQQENTGLPRYRQDRVFNTGSAFTEGWALYAEQLAAENNWYEGDTVGRLGQLDAELFRARRLVVDTGLHAMKWTRQQGIDYGIPAAEVERYVVMPGQACAYKIGMLRILDLRAKAQAALGDKFSIKGFHNTVLDLGNVPLSALEQAVDEWVAKQKTT